jgi:hypothetical protein
MVLKVLDLSFKYKAQYSINKYEDLGNQLK